MSEEEQTNYFQIIEGTEVYYGWYVKQLQQENKQLQDKLDEIKEYLRSRHFEANFQSTNKKDILSIIDKEDI